MAKKKAKKKVAKKKKKQFCEVVIGIHHVTAKLTDDLQNCGP